MWTTAERIKYHQSQTVYDSKSTVMCNNADIPGPSPNHKTALSLTSCKFCRAEVCTHPEKDYGCEEEMSLCGRFAHNKEIRETKRGRQNLQVFLSHILTLKTGLSYSRTNGLRFPPPLRVSESKTPCKFWIYGLRLPPTVLSSTVAETASHNPKWMEKIVLCRVGEKDGSWWEEGRLSFSILRWMILTGVCVSRG